MNLPHLPGLRACGKHGRPRNRDGQEIGHGDGIDINCRDCHVLPKLQSEGAYVKALRKFYGLDPNLVEVAVGEQLVFGEVA